MSLPEVPDGRYPRCYRGHAREADELFRAGDFALAEAFRRSGRFGPAAPLLRAAGRVAAAEKLESFEGQVPYEITAETGPVRVPFAVTEPLPVLEVRANGCGPVSFFIDTGVADVILDPAFAAAIGVTALGTEQGTFAGGKRSTVAHGRLDSLSKHLLGVTGDAANNTSEFQLEPGPPSPPSGRSLTRPP